MKTGNILKPLILIMLFLFGSNLNAQSYQDLMTANQAENNKDWNLAVQAYKRITTTNPYNGKYWYQLGWVNYNLKEYAKSTDAYKMAVKTGYLKGPALYNIACNYALSNDTKEAITWLKKASSIKHAYNEESLLTDNDLDNLRNTDAFKKMLPPQLPKNIDRIKGWEWDIKYFDNQMKLSHYNLFHDLSEKEWNDGIKKIKSKLSKIDDNHIIINLMKLASKVKDGHTIVIPAFQGKLAFHQLPIIIKSFKEGDFIVSTSPEMNTYLGGKIVRINQTPVNEIKKRIQTILPSDKGNHELLRSFGNLYMVLPEILYGLDIIDNSEKVSVYIEKDGKEQEISFQGNYLDFNLGTALSAAIDASQANVMDTNNLPLYLKNANEIFWYEFNPITKILYCQINQIRRKNEKDLGSLGKELRNYIDSNDVQALVLDLRLNRGGDGSLNQAFIHEIIKCEKINQKGKLFTIIGSATFSAAMNLTADLEKHTQTIFVGMPTGSSPNHFGDDNMHKLTYSGILFGAANAYWQSKNSYDFRKWIAPDLIAEPTFEAYRQNRDVAMETIEMLFW